MKPEPRPAPPPPPKAEAKPQPKPDISLEKERKAKEQELEKKKQLEQEKRKEDEKKKLETKKKEDEKQKVEKERLVQEAEANARSRRSRAATARQGQNAAKSAPDRRSVRRTRAGRGNISSSELAGNPQVEFEVRLCRREIMEGAALAQQRNRLMTIVERPILKSSPLPFFAWRVTTFERFEINFIRPNDEQRTCFPDARDPARSPPRCLRVAALRLRTRRSRSR